jgi:RNase P subunit RPR2
MKYNIPLKNYRKKFCKKCFSPYKNSKIRIKGDKKITVCENCGHINRLKIKTS